MVLPSTTLSKQMQQQKQRSSSSTKTNTSSTTTTTSCMGFVGKIIESVYRCDSAAAIAEAYQCGSLAQEALYQGVEVVYKCDGDRFRAAAADFYDHHHVQNCYCGNGSSNHDNHVEYHTPIHPYGNLIDAFEQEARNDVEDGEQQTGGTTTEDDNHNNNVTDEQPRFNDAALSFEDSILNGPNSINDLSSAGSSLLDAGSVASTEEHHNTKSDTKNNNITTPVTDESFGESLTTSGFCF